MLQQLDSEPEHDTETPLVILGDFNDRHLLHGTTI